MLIAALLVGLVTAYYFGLRPGMAAAGATAALFAVAMVVPAIAIWAYAAVGLGVAGVCLAGPKLKLTRRGTASGYASVARGGAARVIRLVKRRATAAATGDKDATAKRRR